MLLWIVVIVGFVIFANRIKALEEFRKEAEYKVNTALSKAKTLEKEMDAANEELKSLRRALKEKQNEEP